ncbi:MAG TPA: hypothetical protein VFU49_11285 [Ktedonobacteraceae bacterium]|nr:hypothetical protein [Ktedonobacteraceae bacterium]
MDGKDFTLKALVECAKKSYGLYSWDDGEFLSFERSDHARNTVHVHFYTADIELDDDKVTIKGHAIWVKSKDGDIRKPFTLTATRHRNYWVGGIMEGEVETTIESRQDLRRQRDSNKNTETRLFEEVVNKLPGILADTLNETD